MSENLAQLAERYLHLTGEIESVRRSMLAVLSNGEGPNPSLAQRRSEKASQHPNAALAAEAEAKIIELIKTTPGMRTTEIAKAMDSKVNTTTQRLARMR